MCSNMGMSNLSRGQKKVLLRRLYMLAQATHSAFETLLRSAFLEASGDSLSDTVLTSTSANGASVGYALRQLGSGISKADAAEVYGEFLEMLESLKPSITSDADKFAALMRLVSLSAARKYGVDFSGGRGL